MPATPVPFEVSCDPRNNLLIIRMHAFWDPATAGAFMQAVDAAVTRLPCTPGEHVTLIDLSRFAVQAKDVLATIVGYARDAEPRARRMAWIGGSPLQMMQLRRSLDEMGGELFDTFDDAYRWITDGKTPPKQPL